MSTVSASRFREYGLPFGIRTRAVHAALIASGTSAASWYCIGTRKVCEITHPYDVARSLGISSSVVLSGAAARSFVRAYRALSDQIAVQRRRCRGG